MKKWIIPVILIISLLGVTGCGTGTSGSDRNADISKNDNEKMISSQNQLGFDLLPEVKTNNDGNTFISPTSLFMALSMVYNGADGVTKEEMAKVLHADGMDVKELNKANTSFMSRQQNDSNHAHLQIANSMWLNQRFHFQKEFSQYNQDYFNATIKEIDPTDIQSPKMINDWVKNSTNGKIKEIVGNLDPNFVAILINAIYFKGDWLYQFDEKLTDKGAFHLENGTNKDAPFMTLTKKLDYMENKEFQAVILPYAGEKMSMKVFLPKKGISLEKFEKMLKNDNWQKWSSEFHKSDGTVLLPKFHIEYEVLLQNTLKKLGMTTAFDEGANFSKMIQEKDPVWINEVKQKTYLNVNETGTEAAAVTSVRFGATSARVNEPFRMEMNRPFFIAITNDETGAILFMGKVCNPVES